MIFLIIKIIRKEKRMSEVDKNKQFRGFADTFIDVANNHIDEADSSFVSSSMLYGTSRFCSFVVASGCKNAEEFEANMEGAVDFYTKEFKRMLSENLEEYKKTYAEAPRYEHLINK